MTKDNRLTDSYYAVNIRDCLVFFVLISTFYIVLLNIVQRFLLSGESNYNGIRYNIFGKLHDQFLISSREKHHLAVPVDESVKKKHRIIQYAQRGYKLILSITGEYECIDLDVLAVQSLHQLHQEPEP